MTDQPNEQFPKAARLVHQKDFDRVFKDGLVASDDVLVVHVCPNALAWTRLGLSVSKRVGDAPVRNRWKRLIREVFRKKKSQLPHGLDLVIRPRKGASPIYSEIESSLPRLVHRLDKRLRNAP